MPHLTGCTIFLTSKADQSSLSVCPFSASQASGLSYPLSMTPPLDVPFPISRQPDMLPQRDQGCSQIVEGRGEQCHI